jgi:ribose transport system substrate-binding protein
MPKRAWWLIAALLIATVALSACGSDDEADSGESATKSNGNSIVAEAKQSVEAAKEPLTEWTGPEASPAPQDGKVIHVISCSPDTEGCQRDVDGAVEAAEAIGWEVKKVQTDGTPQEFVNTMNEAMDSGVDGIIAASFPVAAISTALERAEKEGVPVVTMISGNESPAVGADFKGGLFAEVNAAGERQGELVADWIISATNGEAKVGVLHEKDFPIIVQRVDGFTQRFADCDGCEIKDVLNVPVSVLAKDATPTVLQFIRANPDVNYFYSSYDGGAIFAIQGIKQAGAADKVPAIGVEGNSPNLDLIRKDDVQRATVAVPSEWIGWAAVDQLNRAFNGEPPAEQWTPEGGGIPSKIIDKTNLPPEGEVFTGDSVDFRTKFEELWGAN